mgnify:CR=1 FL=1
MMPGIAEYEIPRDLRDQREEKQVLSVFAAVPRVKEASIRRKQKIGKADLPISRTMRYQVISVEPMVKSTRSRFPVGEDQNAGVVDQHQDTGKKFQGTAA